jgi:pimeloyl-ACP methyl ester carboxylesterase
MTASVLLLAAITSTAAGFYKGQPLCQLGGDPSPGLLVNVSPHARPFDPPDPSRPSVVFVHGFNPVPRAVHFTMAEELAAALARRGGPPLNVLAWEWNAATFVGLSMHANQENSVAQGCRLAGSLRAAGLPPGRIHLIAQSSGSIVATSAARALCDGLGQRVGQLTLLDPATNYHELVFTRLRAGTTAGLVENYWAPGLSGFGRPVACPGVLNVRVDGPSSLVGAVYFPRSAHWNVVSWYLATVEDRSYPGGFNVRAADLEGP